MNTQYTALEEAAQLYSDLHKDVYGIRPYIMAEWTVEDFDKAMDRLAGELKRVQAEEADDKARCAAAFEKRILATIQVGAKTREQAIEWIAMAEGASDDREFLCYILGLPYGYFNKVVA